jgi:filamentous hemagglutinin
VAADIAYGIGNQYGPDGVDPNLALSTLSHAVLGCAASAALGTGCAGGAIGGATSALLSPSVVSALDPSGAPLNATQTAIVAAIAILAGSVTAGLAGANAQAGATFAENEALNNSTLHPAQQTWISQNAAAFAAYYLKTTGQSITTDQAIQMLLGTAYIVNDETAANGPGYNAVAGNFIASSPTGSALFSPTAAEWSNPGQLATTSGPATPEQAALPGSTANPLLGLTLATLLTGGLALGPEAAAGCALNIVLCINQAGILAGEVAAGGAMPAGTGASVGGSSTVGATNTAVTSEGTANSATYQGLTSQLTNQNLANIAAQDSRLAAAVNGSGTSNPNFSIGTGTVAEANALGQVWVGDGATLVSNQVACPGCLVSADGTMIYRPPQPKSSPFATTGVQANFVQQTPNGTVISNGHLNVTP